MRRNLLTLNLITMLFFTSTEIIESVLPFFLVNYLGASMLIVGIIEGFSEGFSNFLKIIGGYISDFKRKRDIIGFGLLSIFLSSVSFLFVKRWSDLILSIVLKDISEGSLIPARDFSLSLMYRRRKAEIFSINRIFENVGQLFGVSIIFFYSIFFIGYGIYYVFLLSSGITLLALFLFFMIEERYPEKGPKKSISWKILYPNYLILFSIFSFVNFGYSFSILKVYSQVESISISLGFYLIFSFLLVVSTFYAGKLFDYFGEEKFLRIAFVLFAISHIFFIIFPIVGLIIMAVSEGMFEIGLWATIGNKVKYRKGFVFGAYHFIVGIMSMLSGMFIGYMWDRFGSDVPFYFGVIASFIGYLYTFRLKR